MVQDDIKAVSVINDAMFWNERKQIATLALRHKMPSMFAIRAHVDEGGLISYGPSYHALFNRAATYIDKILKGERPADLTLADVPRGSRPGERRGLRRSLFAFVPADSGL